MFRNLLPYLARISLSDSSSKYPFIFRETSCHTSCATHSSARTQGSESQAVQGVRSRPSPTASKSAFTVIWSIGRLRMNPPPGPRTDLMRSVFFNLKKICSRNFRRDLFLLRDLFDRNRFFLIGFSQIENRSQGISTFCRNSHPVFLMVTLMVGDIPDTEHV